MSFDLRTDTLEREVECVSIPLEQGNVFRPKLKLKVNQHLCLNPFGTGQCLSTTVNSTEAAVQGSLNPFGTGQCLSTAVGC